MLIFALTMALLAQAGEWLAMPMPDGFVTGHKQRAQMGSIEERVPAGETVNNWTRMITLITLNGDLNPEIYAREFDKQMVRGCRGGKAAPRTASRMGEHPAIDGRFDCPLNPATGKPETMFYRLASIPGHVQMVQIAFRSVPDAAGVRWAGERLDTATLCAPDSADPVCKR